LRYGLPRQDIFVPSQALVVPACTRRAREFRLPPPSRFHLPQVCRVSLYKDHVSPAEVLPVPLGAGDCKFGTHLITGEVDSEVDRNQPNGRVVPPGGCGLRVPAAAGVPAVTGVGIAVAAGAVAEVWRWAGRAAVVGRDFQTSGVAARDGVVAGVVVAVVLLGTGGLEDGVKRLEGPGDRVVWLSPGNGLLPAALASFAKLHPDASVALRRADWSETWGRGGVTARRHGTAVVAGRLHGGGQPGPGRACPGADGPGDAGHPPACRPARSGAGGPA
jgi:hypothetical protein